MYDCSFPALLSPLVAIYYTNKSQQPDAIYLCGEIVWIPADYGSPDEQPKDCKKFWIWEQKWDPNYKTSFRDYFSYGHHFYLLKDGPGEKAKDLGWVIEDKIRDWYPPKVEESLIDLDPGYEEVKKEQEGDLIEL